MNTMKKLTLTIALVLGMTLGAWAQKSSGSTLFQNPYEVDDSESFFEYLQQMFIMEEDLEEDPFAAEYEGLSNDGGMFGGGGLFQRGAANDYTLFSGNRDGNLLNLPSMHGLEVDQEAPLGGGIALLIGLGGAYLVKKRKENK